MPPGEDLTYEGVPELKSGLAQRRKDAKETNEVILFCVSAALREINHGTSGTPAN